MPHGKIKQTLKLRKVFIMHKLLADIFEEHPGKTVYLSLGWFPCVTLDNGTMEVTTGSDAPLTPEKMAEIVNSLITDEDGAALKRQRIVVTRMEDELYQRVIIIEHNPKSVHVEITSTLLSDIEAENNKLIAAFDTLALIKG
jgi:hypothetical protein